MIVSVLHLVKHQSPPKPPREVTKSTVKGACCIVPTAENWTRLSCHDFVDNQVRLQLSALAYNLGNFLRWLALPESVKKWSLTTLREKLIEIGANAVRHSRYLVFRMAEVVVPKALLSEILERIGRLRASAELAGSA
jgi:hypothetical protein